ncbi:hypothetical protein Ahy_B02g058295 isoform E [Arachis hypogaea]|uniref:Uncharacterized protein n=1 Tax=Arachis hypogaea TaxID=3818 RepID=A0A445AEC8_ARAHY|nr:hypothetical protein Ahy_B02g058295 isoform E [Arachis hypogaea]
MCGFGKFILCPLYYYYQKHPVNYLLLGIFTVSFAFVVGLTCAFSGKVILESVILTTAVILFPLGKLSVMIYGCLASIIFCGYIIYDTDNLIKEILVR